MIKNVYLYQNSTPIDLKPYIIGQISVENRNDKVFATGSFTFENTSITKAIAPNTPLKIVFGDNTFTWWLASSTETYNMVAHVHRHSVSLIDAIAITTSHFVNTKVFSTTGTNRKESEQLNIIKELVNQNEHINMTLNNLTLFQNEVENSFSDGTQLWTALVSIVSKYNYLPYITDISYSCYSFTIDFRKTNSTYYLNESNILNIQTSQNAEQYTKVLSANLKDVIDRTNINRVEGLTVRADEIELKDSTAYLKLPAKVERITKFEAAIPNMSNLNVGLAQIPLAYMPVNVMPNTPTTKDSFVIGDYKDNEHFKPIYDWIKEELHPIFIDSLDTSTFRVNQVSMDQHYGYNVSASIEITPSQNNFDISKYLLEKSEYDANISTANKTKYAVYQKYTDIIEHMFAYYRNDFWDNLIGGTRYPFLHYAIEELEGTYSRQFGNFNTQMTTSLKLSVGDNPMNYMFNVEYVPCVNVKVESLKSDYYNKDNESTFKISHQTYNGASSQIDFDKVVNDIQKTNDSMGRMETYLTLKTDDLIYSGQKVSYNGDWYISSVQSNYDLVGITEQVINLSRVPVKIADAISIDTQYESTPNPIDNYVDRMIYVEFDYNIDVVRKVNYYAECTFKVGASNIKLYKPCSIIGDLMVGGFYVVFEADDNYSFGAYTETTSKSKKIMKDAAYGNLANEFTSMNFRLIRINNLTQAQSYAMPKASISSNQIQEIAGVSNVKIYKDARERLLFTIFFRNGIIF